MNDDASIHPAARGFLAAMLLALVGAVGWALVTVPRGDSGLWPQIQVRLDESGAANPVTAVLLNFRAYDTLLEIGVLTIALLAIWSLYDPSTRRLYSPPGRVLERVVSVLVPLMVLVAGYILWAGTSLPGGAFPAGAIATSAVVLLLLTDLDVTRVQRWLLDAGIVIGLLVFVGAGGVGSLVGGEFLEYPKGWAGPMVMTVEVAGTISIALILAGIFAGRASGLSQASRQPKSDRESS